jgi:hypothetical protein
MSFQEKSAIAITAALIVVYGAYFTIVGRLLGGPAGDVAYKPLLILAVVPLTVLAAISHIVLALTDWKGANSYDERDRVIARRAERIGGYVLAVGVFAGLVLAMAEVRHSYIANALMLAWVLAELTDNAMKIVFYRRGT